MPPNSPIHFNPDRKTVCDNESDYGGNIAETSGIELERNTSVDSFKGDFAVGSKLFPHTDLLDDEFLTLVSQFAYTNANWSGVAPEDETFNWYACAVATVLLTSDLNDPFDTDTSTNAPASTLSGDMTVFGKSRAFSDAETGSGTLSTVGGPSTQIIVTGGSMEDVLRDGVVHVSPAPPIKGEGRLYTDQNGGTNVIHLSGAALPQGFNVGTNIRGSNPVNPTPTIDAVVTSIIDSTTFVINVVVDIVYGIGDWTYRIDGGSASFYAASDGTGAGITSYEAIDLSLGGYAWTYQNLESLVDQLLVGTTDDIWMLTQGEWTPNWWTDTLSQQPFLAPPKFCVLPSLGRLYIIDDIYIHYIQRFFGYVVPFTFRNQFAEGDECKWVANDDTTIYIGVENPTTGLAGVWVYQPLASTENDRGDLRFFDMNAQYQGCGTGWVWKNVLFINHPDGSIKAFNGSSFDVYAYTPGFKKNVPFVTYRHGVAVDGKSMYFLTAGNANYYAAGLWKLDIDTRNFYLQSQPITRPEIANELPQVGELVLADAGGLFFDGEDYLAGIVARDGLTQDSVNAPLIVASTNRFDNAATLGGWFATSKLVFKSVKEALGTLWTKYMFFSDEAVKLRFRSKAYRNGTPGNRAEDAVIWKVYNPPSGPSVVGVLFTTTANVSEVEVGDEVTITHGANAGWSAFVVTSGVSSGIFSVLLDEEIGLQPNVVSYVTWRKWKRIKDLEKQQLQSDDTKIPFGDNPSEWVQFKVVMDGDNPSVKDIRLTAQDNVK